MHACVDQLAVKVLGSDAGDECIGDFIVESVENWFDSCINEAFVACITPLDQVVCSSALDWFSQDDVGITVAECEDAAVAFQASEWKHAWEVCADEALQLFKFKCIGCDLVASINL